MKSLVVSLAALVAASTFAVAQDPAQLPQSAQAAIADARKECAPEKATLKPGFLQTKDVNGDGRVDYILDYGAFECGGAATFYCGTGGCLTQVFASRDDGSHVKVLDENVRQLNFAKRAGRPAMILDLHGSACGRVGAERCGLTLYWNGDKFSPAN
jgi:hypothetical protein